MKLAVSIDKNYSNYQELAETLNKIEFTELVGISHPLLETYRKETNAPIQTFDIKWNEMDDATNIKESAFGKKYNADAPLQAATKVVQYATHLIVFGHGDYNVNKLGQESLEQIIRETKKRYKF